MTEEQALLTMSFTQEILLFVGDISPEFTGEKIIEMATKIKMFAHGKK